jgi:hypothetical protein
MRYLGGILAVVFGLAACGSGSTSSPSGAKPSSKPAHTASGPTLALRLTAAGVNCHGQQLVGDVDCTFKGQKVTVTPGKFSANEKLRKRACDGGFIDLGYVVATDRTTVTVLSDYNSITQAVAKAMRLTVVPYCP